MLTYALALFQPNIPRQIRTVLGLTLANGSGVMITLTHLCCGRTTSALGSRRVIGQAVGRAIAHPRPSKIRRDVANNRRCQFGAVFELPRKRARRGPKWYNPPPEFAYLGRWCGVF